MLVVLSDTKIVWSKNIFSNVIKSKLRILISFIFSEYTNILRTFTKRTYFQDRIFIRKSLQIIRSAASIIEHLSHDCRLRDLTLSFRTKYHTENNMCKQNSARSDCPEWERRINWDSLIRDYMFDFLRNWSIVIRS